MACVAKWKFQNDLFLEAFLKDRKTAPPCSESIEVEKQRMLVALLCRAALQVRPGLNSKSHQASVPASRISPHRVRLGLAKPNGCFILFV